MRRAEPAPTLPTYHLPPTTHRVAIMHTAGPALILLLCSVAAPGGAAGQCTAALNDRFQELSDQAARAQHEGKEEDAIRLYMQALEIRPQWPEGWLNAGMLLADRHDYARAEAAFRNLLRIEPENGKAWALLGLAEFELGRFDDALQHLQRGRARRVGNVDLDNVATFHAALILIWKGDFQVAQKLLIRVARGGGEDPDLIIAFGLAALRISTWPDKLEASRKPLVNRVGTIEYQATHTPLSDTVAAYQDLVAEFSRVPGVHYAFGNFLIDVGHYQEGLEQMQQVLDMSPRDVMAHLQMAMTYIKTNEPEKALPHAEEASRLDPKLFASHYALGWACYKLGRNAQAIIELERAVYLAPDSAQAHFALSQAYLRAHRKAEADREREIFAKLKESEAAASGPPHP